ncbi:MAG: energy-coupled thiamine transporter ThiT [Firmicutes bacterium]|nr:energy-coupled thiamine transporter ThiT [Bacillota bacterium]
MSKQTNKVYSLTLCAALIALSFVLSMIKFLDLPYGGSITLFSMLVASLTGYFCGPKWGITAGIALGLLNLITDPQMYYPLQVFLDYILAFACLGLSGFFRNMKGGLFVGYIVAISGRFLCSFLSGFIFFAEYAPEGMNPIIYSFIYNITYIGVEGILSLIVIVLPPVHLALENQKNKVSTL